MISKSPFPPTSHLVAYLRDSGGDEQDLSVDQQEQAIRAWCDENGYILDQVFTDNRTGTTTIGRVGFERMMSFFRQRRRPNVAGLVIWRYSRFSRDLDDAQYYKADLRRRGFKIYSMRDVIPDGIDGRFFETAYDWKSAKDIEILSDEVKRGQKHILRNFGALGGFPPRGFKREEMTIGTRRDGRPHVVARWVPDPELWETCRLAWKMRAGGASYKEINQVTHLFDSLNSYTTMFRNRLYLGELEFSGEIIKDYVEPMIDLATWNAVQAMNRTRAANTGPDNPNNAARSGSSYILSGLALCARCNAPLNGNTIAFKNNSGIRQYYHCSRAGRAPHLCQAPNIPKVPFETIVLESVIEQILSPLNLAIVQQELLAEYQDRSEDTLARRSELAQQIGNIRRSLNNLTSAIAEAGHSAALLNKLRELETREIQLADELSQIDAWMQTPPDQLTPDQLLRYSDALRTVIFNGDINTQREVLRAFIDRIVVERTGNQISGVIHYYQPPTDLLASVSDPDPPDYVYALNPSGGTKGQPR